MRTLILILCLASGLPDGADARQAAVAGQFYPGDKKELAAFVDAAIAAGKKADGAVALVAPHAGYPFSGRLAGLAYAAAGDSYDTVVVLGTAHTEAVKGAALLGSDFYETPLGRVEPDRALGAALMKASPLFEERPSAHAREHSVEVQLPFLQRRLKKPFKLLGAVMNTGDAAAAREVGAALAAALKGKKALIVVSADFSHYPSSATAAASDGAMALAIASMDPRLAADTARIMEERGEPGLETCACGAAALTAGMEAALRLGAGSFKLLGLSDSHAEAPSLSGPERVVGYLAGAFVKGGKPASLELSAAQKKALLKEARAAIGRAFAGDGRQPLSADPRLNLPGAAFVTLTVNGALRGCVGTTSPVMTLADAVRFGAVSAALRDGRFSPVTAGEMKGIKIEVSVLSPMRRAAASDVKPGLGVIISRGGHSGLFLPQVWEQIPDKENFMGELCSQKAGLRRGCWKDAGAEIYTFGVDAFSEPR